ncbi:TonB-dependent siderophore receptor [Henriciella litoralis]|uniref:TonB-dependent siderophore receptor n=1 Tax=Henriciella litoralis TaxID=568102 RepID=UPI0009FE41CE|nr:TonB-dependent siderophore receptor [Henriciella litoralis]
MSSSRSIAFLSVSVSLAALTFAQQASAQSAPTQGEDAETRQETVIVTGSTPFGATKTSTPIVETARSLSVETDDMFIDKGALNLASALAYVSGVTAEPYGFSTRGDFPQSRGLELPRYRDSIQELFGSYNSTRADTYTIEQIEVLKGPASVLYGQGSPGGIVNYVSKTPRETFGGELVAEVGNFDRYQIAGDVTGPIGGDDSPFAFRLVGLYRDTGTQIDQVDEQTTVFMPSLSWQATPDTKFTLIGLVQDTDSDAAAQFIPVEGTLFPLKDGTYLDTDVYVGEPGFNRYNTESQQVTLLGEHRINDNWMVEGTALWRSGEADYHQAWATFTGAGQSRYLNDILAAQPALAAAAAAQGLTFTDTTVPRSFYQGDNTFDQLAGDIRLRGGFTTGALEHDLLAGVQYQDVETDSDTANLYGGGALAGDFRYVLDLKNPVYGNYPDQSVFDALLTDTPTNKVKDLGLYVSDQISLDKWRFTIGVRADSVENEAGAVTQDDDAISTSFGVLYRFDNGFAPYASYSESFETVVGTDNQGNQLDPQEARQYEAGVKYEPRGLPGLVTVAYYDIEISNLPNPNSLPGTAAQQQGVATLKGFEAEARLQFDDIYLQAAASTVDADDPNGFQLAAIPETQASFWTTWRPSGALEGFKAGVGVRYVGETVSENGTLSYTTPDYTLADLMVGYEWDHWDLALNARNVTDEEYLTGCLTRGDCFPGLRRTVVANLRYKF